MWGEVERAGRQKHIHDDDLVDIVARELGQAVTTHHREATPHEAGYGFGV